MINKNIRFKIGHVLIQVDSIETAISRYRELGFQVIPGGLPGKTYNAMIYLKDGSFLELFSTENGRLLNALMNAGVKIIKLFDRAFSDRISRYMPGNSGLRDYALDSVPADQFKENIDKVRLNGLPVSKEHPKTRTDYRGIKRKWSLCWPDSVTLPFLMSGYTPPLDIGEDERSHQNGVIGIKELRISTSQWERSYREYSLLLGLEPEVRQEGDRRNSIFRVQKTSVFLSENERAGLEHVEFYSEKAADATGPFPALPAFLSLSGCIKEVTE